LSFFEVWRFITAVFLHGNLLHLFFNLFALALFGSILEKLIGGSRFLVVFFVSGILANLISVNFYSVSLGASGAIFGVIGALIVIRPLLFVWAFGAPMPIFLAGIFWVLLDILGTYGFFIGHPLDNTGNIAHLSGMFFGLIFRGRVMRTRLMNQGIVIDEKAMMNWEDRYMR